jgi:electron transfer flavoprotein beta subunit
LPFAGVITGLDFADGGKKAIVTKEFFGGLRGQLEVPLPAVLGIQAAEKPPRYVPVAKVRAAMKTAKFETIERSAPTGSPVAEITRMYKPVAAGRAEMIEGSTEAITDRILGILVEKGFVAA